MAEGSVDVRRWGGDEAELQSIAALYGSVFSEPPYLESAAEAADTFTERVWRYSASKPDFCLAFARLEELHAGNETVGLILGSGVDQSDWWWSTVTSQLEPSRRRWWMDRRCFAIAELAVTAKARRTGTASQLVAKILEDLSYEVALLTCDPRATAAVNFYRSNGWQTVENEIQLGDGVSRILFAKVLNFSPGVAAEFGRRIRVSSASR